MKKNPDLKALQARVRVQSALVRAISGRAKPGRKPLPEAERRVKVSFRVSPQTAKLITQGASLHGDCAGRYLDYVFRMAEEAGG